MKPLLLALALCVVGCGGNSTPTGESTPPPPPKTDVKQTKDGKDNTTTTVPD